MDRTPRDRITRHEIVSRATRSYHAGRRNAARTQRNVHLVSKSRTSGRQGLTGSSPDDLTRQSASLTSQLRPRWIPRAREDREDPRTARQREAAAVHPYPTQV